MTWDELERFRSGVRSVEEDEGVTLTLQDTVVMASWKEIYAEYRFFVFDGEVVTGSRHKFGDQVAASVDVPDSVLTDGQPLAGHGINF